MAMKRRTFLAATAASLAFPKLAQATALEHKPGIMYWVYPDGCSFYFDVMKDDTYIGSLSVEDMAEFVESNQQITAGLILQKVQELQTSHTPYEEWLNQFQNKREWDWHGPHFPLERLTEFSLPARPGDDIWAHNGFVLT